MANSSAAEHGQRSSYATGCVNRYVPAMTGRYIRTPAIPDEQIKGGFYVKTRISAVRMEDMENEAA
jgi:hypothetical protein